MATMEAKILLVEDDETLLEMYSLKLRDEGFNLLTATDGLTALDLALKERPLVILLDIMMPKLDGFGVLEQMKVRNYKMPAIVLSNLGQSEDEKRARDLGANKFFVKSNTPIMRIVDYAKEILR